jgi:phenylacetate-CoA ligase
MLTEANKLATIISICNHAIENSPFYRQTLRKGPRTWEDFYALPLLTGQQIRQHVDPHRNFDLLTGSPKGAVLVSTSASTGPRKLIYREYREQARISKRLAMALRLAGITAEDTVANMFIPGNLAGAWMGMHEAIQHLGASVLPIGNAINTEEQSELIHWLKPTALVGFPSTLIRLVQQGLPSVQKILCGGEGLSWKVRNDLETSLGLKIPLVYANIESGIIGLQCQNIWGSNQYHIIDGDLFVEIIDSETGYPSKEGEIVVTHLHRRLQPVIRYRIGDIGKWVNKPCSCGLSSPRIELKGRVTDKNTRINGIIVEYSEIESALSDLSGYQGRFQIRVNKAKGKDTAIIYIEGETMSKDDVYAAMNTRVPKVSTLIQENQLEAVIVQQGKLPTLPTQGGKVLRIVDER